MLLHELYILKRPKPIRGENMWMWNPERATRSGQRPLGTISAPDLGPESNGGAIFRNLLLFGDVYLCGGEHFSDLCLFVKQRVTNSGEY